MLSSRQRAYLGAMDIDVWSLRKPPSTPPPVADVAPKLNLGPGSGGILLVCALDTDSASRLANDICRALGGAPVWAWPHTGTAAVSLDDAIEENLFTMVAIFGEELAGQFFADGLPDNLNSAKLILLPAMQDLRVQADARRLLWTTFCRSGMVSNGERRT